MLLTSEYIWEETIFTFRIVCNLSTTIFFPFLPQSIYNLHFSTVILVVHVLYTMVAIALSAVLDVLVWG